MTDASKWRFKIAEQMAASYAQNSKVRVVMVAGSVGRGVADRYSDLEMDLADGIREWKRLIDEVMDLVDQHGEGFDTTPFRDRLNQHRQVWDDSPI